MRILLLDIETAPNTVYTWGLFDQNIAIEQIIESSYVLCWAAKFLEQKEIMFERTKVAHRSSKSMLSRLHKLMSEADSIMTYNGERFDVPTVNREFLLNGFKPPAPAKQIDIYKSVKHKFRFASNKMDHVCRELELGHKVEHDGFRLWVDCMNNKPSAWKTMEKYNRNDVVMLEKLFYKVRPWIKVSPSHPIVDGRPGCPNCGSKYSHADGFAYTAVSKFRRYQCMDCYHYFRTNISELDRGTTKYVSLS